MIALEPHMVDRLGETTRTPRSRLVGVDKSPFLLAIEKCLALGSPVFQQQACVHARWMWSTTHSLARHGHQRFSEAKMSYPTGQRATDPEPPWIASASRLGGLPLLVGIRVLGDNAHIGKGYGSRNRRFLPGRSEADGASGESGSTGDEGDGWRYEFEEQPTGCSDPGWQESDWSIGR